MYSMIAVIGHVYVLQLSKRGKFELDTLRQLFWGWREEVVQATWLMHPHFPSPTATTTLLLEG